ncbi:NAD(P)H-dependent flavin oxidoreductase [Roseococcus sp. YIM B11640]|uniref:NAD(P)H-dependent flavin oxidoreductase n=1 Tax=Roseococcus sp. YIM B11640 TaxID=3133973 RepID=UPI003C7A76A9
MSISTRLTQLFGIERPILLAAMDKLADARLAEAVSAAGGLGILGGGYGDADWLRQEAAKLATARERTGLKFGIGFITWSMAKQPELLDLALEAKPDAVWLSFGDPAPHAERAKAAGAKVICQVQSVAMAEEALAKGADVIVAQGAEAGGHGASRGTFALVPAVVDAVGDKAVVVAAGGVGDGRGLAAAMMLGAEGVVLGSRFYASIEAAANEEAKRRIVNASGDDTIRSLIFDISRNNIWPAPFTGRVLMNEHARKWMDRELELTRHMAEEGPRYAAAREAGDFDVAAVIAGEAISMIHDVLPAGEIVRNITEEAEALLARGQGWRL